MNEQLQEILTEIAHRPIRSSIITAAALMETMLEQLLDKFLVPDANKKDLFSYQGCLGTFSSKIEMAYALGLISKELHDDMNLFRKIRNDCAHSLQIDANSIANIKSKAGNFKLLHKVFTVGKTEDVLIYTSLEFSIIFICLIKRVNNIEALTSFPCEAHYDYLGFDEKDSSLIENFSEFLRRK